MVRTLPIPAFKDNYIWLFHRETNHDAGRNNKNTNLEANRDVIPAVVVDPGDSGAVIDALERHSVTPVAILVTHHHWDHVGGIPKLLNVYDIPVYGPAEERIEGITHPLSDGDNVSLPNNVGEFQVIAVPGHTVGHIAFFGEGMLFCGDTLFGGGCGRLFEGTATQMYNSLNKIAALPKHTYIYCAHEYTLSNLAFAKKVEPANEAIWARIEQTKQLRAAKKPSVPSTLELEQQTNPFLRCEHKSVKHSAERNAGRSLSTPEAVFAVIRRWKDVS